MARYVYLVKYTPEALKAVREDGYANRVTVIERLTESVGGRLEQIYFINSPEWDFVNIAEVDADGAFAINSMAEASGTIERGLMFELFTAEEADHAISAQLLWTPPGAS